MKPVIAVTMGDPCGIGPEIIFKLSNHPSLLSQVSIVVLGDFQILKKASVACKGKINCFVRQPLSEFDESQIRKINKKILFVDFERSTQHIHKFGKISAWAGQLSGEFIELGTQLALNKRVHALVTGPINKVAFKLGGYGEKFRGHTEMISSLTRSKNTALMLVYENLRAIHVTSHIPFKEVSKSLSIEKIFETIKLSQQAGVMFGIKKPNIVVCGLNPHAGDEGVLGREEIELIGPAIQKAKRMGILVQGPIAADVAWGLVKEKVFDIGVAMSHDQGQIPVKLLAFRFDLKGNPIVRGVNVTVGLPIIRTSVMHGTAFDIAGKGISSELSLIDAIQLSLKMKRPSLR